ncbi:MAG: N-acyl homoserine lactonase family protein [Proteobacteria bacterium]|nr:N-acyl homoserine lactonase family protein [Pseudomonadota bacterium]
MEPFEVYAVRYARVDRRPQENFIAADPHDGPMSMDYFVWAVVGPQRSFIVDTGFNQVAATRRRREFLRCPTDGLSRLGIEAKGVADVVITHMHYDHVGNHDLFPQATFHLQDREMAFVTGRHMCHDYFRGGFDVDNVTGMVREVFRGRVQFHDGAAELAPGFSLHWVGGHTAGLQVARVWTRRGWLVLASDASHYYANMEQGRPFPFVYHLGDTLEAFGALRRLAASPRHIIPGHDPLVMARYPAPKPELQGIVARLDVEPKDA